MRLRRGTLFLIAGFALVAASRCFAGEALPDSTKLREVFTEGALEAPVIVRVPVQSGEAPADAGLYFKDGARVSSLVSGNVCELYVKSGDVKAGVYEHKMTRARLEDISGKIGLKLWGDSEGVDDAAALLCASLPADATIADLRRILGTVELRR